MLSFSVEPSGLERYGAARRASRTPQTTSICICEVMSVKYRTNKSVVGMSS